MCCAYSLRTPSHWEIITREGVVAEAISFIGVIVQQNARVNASAGVCWARERSELNGQWVLLLVVAYDRAASYIYIYEQYTYYPQLSSLRDVLFQLNFWPTGQTPRGQRLFPRGVKEWIFSKNLTFIRK